ncbi:MAG: sugar transferase, partial [Thermoleophilia bacterium]|nr:sugar transferase [Thermoleophilia bacterium]
IDDIILAITNWQSIRPALMDALTQCWSRGVSITPMPLYYEQTLGAFPIDHLGQNVFALLASGSCGRLWLAVRRGADILVGAVGLLITACLFPFLAAAIWLDSRGPIFYRQVRVGCSGRPFALYKFRSMIPNAEPNGAVWATPNDDRTTRVGRFMRRVRLDELPQFWNLLNGTMTLIGPRPERPEFVKQLEQQIPYYAVRHAVKPGLTGWA